jgi:hypothetical protein
MAPAPRHLSDRRRHVALCDDCGRLHLVGSRCVCQDAVRGSDILYHLVHLWPFLRCRAPLLRRGGPAPRKSSPPLESPAGSARRRGAVAPPFPTVARKRPEGSTSAWADTVPRGACGVPGCGNTRCSVRYGECHCGCAQPTQLATSSDRTRMTVSGEPRRYIAGHSLRRLRDADSTTTSVRRMT